MEQIEAGRVVDAHGIRGDVKVLPAGCEPELLIKCRNVYIGDVPYRVLQGRVHKGCALLRLQGVRTVYGLVSSPNPASEGLHRSLGFRLMGVQQKAGYKNGRWIDLLWFEKSIAPYDPAPAPMIPVGQLPDQLVRNSFHNIS